MIGKGKSISHTGASMSYGWNQEKDAEVVFKQYLIGDDPKQITEEFKMIQQQNHRCINNTLSFVLSPTIEDGKNLNKDQLHEIAQKFINEMKLENHQAIAFVHRDKEHTHIHTYVNRIDFKGEAYNDSFIGKRSQHAAESVAKQMELTTVKEVQKEKLLEIKTIRQEIKKLHEKVMDKYQPENFDKYIKLMQQNNVEVIPSINKTNKLQGFRFEYKGHNLKGSEVHRSMSINKIAIDISKNNTKGLELGVDNTIKLLGKTTALNPDLATKIIEKIAKKAIEKAIDYGMGF